jgi:hypothetical protein
MWVPAHFKPFERFSQDVILVELQRGGDAPAPAVHANR